MNEHVTTRRIVRALSAYGAAVAICLVILVLVMRLWRADLDVPFQPLGDSLFYQAVVKGMIEHGWWLHNGNVGAPFGRQLEDFPIADNLHFLLMKVISTARPHFGFVYNAFFLLTFPLTTVFALWVLRRLGISYPASLADSLLYTFVPYHFLRGENHLFLGSYYLVPVMVLIVIEIYMDRNLLFSRDAAANKTVYDLFSLRSLGTIAFCFIFPFAGNYYAFFACFFLLVAGTAACFHRQTVYPLVRAITLAAVICAGGMATLSPSLVYMARQGRNREVVTRSPLHAELYGLKIDHMLMPVTGHRIGFLARAKAAYFINPLMVTTNNENTYASLGIVGSIGFLILIGRLLYRRPASGGPQLLDGLALLNVFAVLLATIGGFGAVVALLGLTWIRCYYRISIYIAFFALLAVALLWDWFARRYVKSRTARLLYVGALGCALVVGILDQTTRSFVPPYAKLKEEFQVNEDFVGQIEDSVPEGGMIFQLPYVPYPEGGAPHKMFPYDHFRGYVHSRALRWSYGAMKGRPADTWQSAAAEKPLEEMIKTVSAAGFSGIYLDRYGYKDDGAETVDRLRSLLGTPIESAHRRLVFFNMAEYNRKLRQSGSEEEWEAKREAALRPLAAMWQRDFCHPEKIGAAAARWCGPEGRLFIDNPLPRPRRALLKMTCRTLSAEPAMLSIEGPSLSRQLHVNVQPAPVSMTVTVPAGGLAITLACDGERVYAPHDPRVMVFRVESFALEELEEAQAGPD